MRSIEFLPSCGGLGSPALNRRPPGCRSNLGLIPALRLGQHGPMPTARTPSPTLLRTQAPSTPSFVPKHGNPSPSPVCVPKWAVSQLLRLPLTPLPLLQLRPKYSQLRMPPAAKQQRKSLVRSRPEVLHHPNLLHRSEVLAIPLPIAPQHDHVPAVVPMRPAQSQDNSCSLTVSGSACFGQKVDFCRLAVVIRKIAVRACSS